MGDRTGQGRWSVDVIHLTGTPGRRDGEWLRISDLGYHVESSGIAVDGRGRQVAAGVGADRPPVSEALAPVCSGSPAQLSVLGFSGTRGARQAPSGP
jgi:hypothetical protein